MSRILIIDNDKDMVGVLSGKLRAIGFTPLLAFDGATGFMKARTEKPDLIILDIELPKRHGEEVSREHGYEICQELKQDPVTANIPIIMLSIRWMDEDRQKGLRAGADDYIVKPDDGSPIGMGELEERIKKRLREPFSVENNHFHFKLTCEKGQRLIIQINGRPETFSLDSLQIDEDGYACQADDIPQSSGYFYSKNIGRQLYSDIFTSHPAVLGKFLQSLGAVGSEMRLHLHFGGTRDFLRIPIELLHDGVNPFVVKHPLVRYITGVEARQPPINPAFLNSLWRNDRAALKVLLIASNVDNSIPGVDSEIQRIGQWLTQSFESRDIKVQTTTVTTEEASYDLVRDLLRNCPFHIVHYAGHGNHDHKLPGESALYFHEHSHMQGQIKPLRASELDFLFDDSDLRFVYLSNCSGTATAPQNRLLNDDFLGLADAVIHSGVPSVLGFRWPVSDAGAEPLALAFYKSLTRQGSIDRALLDARREVKQQMDQNDLTWLSPMMISQT